MKTTIAIKVETKKRIREFGIKNSTYDEIINDVLDHAEHCDRWWENK